MASNTIRISLNSILLLLVFACQNNSRNNKILSNQSIDTCQYYRYDAHQIVSNLGCQNCHLLLIPGDKDDRGWATFSDLVTMDSLKLIDFVFTKKHKGWYGKTGTFKTPRMDTLSECQIKSVIRYIKDQGRDIPMSNQ